MSRLSFIALFEQINQLLKASPEYELVLYFDDVERFNCSQCGRCCQRPWLIGLDKEYHDKWVEVWNQHPQNRFHGAVIKSEGKFYATLKRNPLTGACVFLESDNACYIQRELGADAQPTICQQYPRSWSRSHDALITHHLLESCYDAPLFLADAHHLKWRFQTREGAKTGQKIMLDTLHALTPEAYHLWLGWLMERLLYPEQGCFQALQQVGEGLASLHNTSSNILQEDDILPLLQNRPSFFSNQEHSERWQFEMVQWLGLPSNWQTLLPPLSLNELHLLTQFIQGYALRRLIVYGQWQEPALHWVQKYTAFALCLLLLQFGIIQTRLQYAPLLTIELLRDLLNHQEPLLFHSRGWLNRTGLMDWDTATCLQEARAMLQFDLTQGL